MRSEGSFARVVGPVWIPQRKTEFAAVCVPSPSPSTFPSSNEVPPSSGPSGTPDRPFAPCPTKCYAFSSSPTGGLCQWFANSSSRPLLGHFLSVACSDKSDGRIHNWIEAAMVTVKPVFSLLFSCVCRLNETSATGSKCWPRQFRGIPRQIWPHNNYLARHKISVNFYARK